MCTKYLSLDRVAELWQRGRACLGQGLDKLICDQCTVAFRRFPPLLSLRRDDGNWIRRTNSFIFLDGRAYVSFGAVIFVCTANLLAFPCPSVNHFLALKPDRNMTAVLQTAQRHRHFLKVSKEEGILSCLFSVQPWPWWIATRDLLRPHDSSAVCVKYTYILGMISNFFFRPSLSVRHRGKIRECPPHGYSLGKIKLESALRVA